MVSLVHCDPAYRRAAQLSHQQFHLVAKPLHELVALGSVVLQGGLSGPLGDRRDAGRAIADRVKSQIVACDTRFAGSLDQVL